MGQAGSVQQKSALRDVLSLRRPNVSATELEEVLRTFCALFPLELQVPDAQLVSSVVGVDVKERKLFDVVHTLLRDQTEQSQRNNGRDMTELLLTTFRRIIRWRELYKLCAKCSLKPFLTCLYRPLLVLSVLETLELMLSPCPGFEPGDKAADRSEAANRRNFGDAGGYEVLRSLLVQYGAAVVKEEQKGSAAAVLEAVLKIFHLTLVSRRVATDMMTCTQAVDALMNARVSLLDLCHCRGSEHEVMQLAIGLVKELFCIVDLGQVHELQESAREFGALLYALEIAVQEDADWETIENGMKVDKSGESEIEMRELCVDLVEVFCAGNTRSKKTVYRIFPVDLFTPAKTRVELLSRHTAASPSSVAHSKAVAGARSARTLPHFSFEFEQPRRTSIATPNASSTNGIVETKRNRVVALAYNAMNFGGGAFERWLGDAREKGEHWREIIQAVRRTHESPELVWRAPMRAELRQALRAEIEALERRRRFMADDESSPSGEQIPRWDHEMFYVEYPSIQAELVVNDYFIEFLIPRVADLTTNYELAEPVVLAWHLSDQLAMEHDEKWAILCVRCLRLVIRRYAMLFHGQLPMQYVLSLLRDHVNHSPAFVRECFLVLHTAIITTRNTPSESFNQLCSTVTRTIVGVLADPVLLATLSTPADSDDEAEPVDAEPEDEVISVVNGHDALIRAGISLLLAIVRRAKFVLRLVRPKRVFLCRLLAVETLNHVTITRLLFVLKQLALQDNSIDSSGSVGSGALYNNLSSASLHSSVASHTSSTSDSNWRSLTLVYVLLASCDPKGMGMCVAAAEFLKESCVQYPGSGSTDGSKGFQSVLSCGEFNDLLNEALGFGGCGMGQLLNCASADKFADTFNASQKRAADVNWGRKQRVRLYRYLKHKYLGYSETNSSKPSWSTLSDAGTEHNYEDDDIFIGNIFLRSYIEGDGEFLNEWTPKMYSELIHALFEELVLLGRRKSAYAGGGVDPLPSPPQQPSLSQSSLSSGGSCAAEPWEVQVLILKALARLVPSHCAEVKIKTEFYVSLLAPLRRSLLSEVDQVRGILSLELFVAILSVSDDRSANTAACRTFLEEKGLRALADSLERMCRPAYQQILQIVDVFGPRRRSNPTSQNMARVLLYRSTDVLSILAKQHAAGIRAISKNPEVVTALMELASRHIITQYADIDAASVCLSCLGGLCHYEELRAVVVNAGGLLSLLDTVAFCPAEELDKSASTGPVMSDRGESDISEDSQHEDSNGNTNADPTVLKAVVEEPQRIPSRYFGAIRSAALVLRACLGPKNASTPGLPTQVLYQLLTPSFVRLLRTSPDQFILELQTTEDISTATLIWTVSMRQRLQKCITTELSKVKTAAAAKAWPRWDPEHFVAADSFRYQYPELTNVLVLHDVYLANFVDTPVEDLDMGDIDMASFSEALLISIQSHENVLRILRERGSSDSAKEAAVRLMRKAMEKLVSTHPQHNLEVAASRDAPLSDSSPAMSSTPTTNIFSADTIAVSNSFSPTDDRDWDITRIERCSSSGIEDLTV